MQQRFEKLTLFFKIISCQLFKGISLCYQENTCDRPSMFSQTVLTFWILFREIFSNSICLGIMENSDKGAPVQISVVFGTREHVDSRRVF